MAARTEELAANGRGFPVRISFRDLAALLAVVFAGVGALSAGMQWAVSTSVAPLLLEMQGLHSGVASIRKDVGVLHSEFDGLRGEVAALRLEVGSLRSEVGALREEVGALGAEVEENRRQIADLRERVAKVEVGLAQVQANQARILEILEHERRTRE